MIHRKMAHSALTRLNATSLAKRSGEGTDWRLTLYNRLYIQLFNWRPYARRHRSQPRLLDPRHAF